MFKLYSYLNQSKEGVFNKIVFTEAGLIRHYQYSKLSLFYRKVDKLIFYIFYPVKVQRHSKDKLGGGGGVEEHCRYVWLRAQEFSIKLDS
jgi:hypothetical protein